MLKKYFEEQVYEKLKNSNDLLYKTLELVLKLFNDKTDKSEMPYIIHLMKVYAGVFDYQEKILALMHDILEDTNVTVKDLEEFGYNSDILNMLLYLTKQKGEYYPDYIDRLISSNNIHVLNVKASDLRHNMDITRIKNPTINDYERVNKRYLPAYNKIQSKIEELRKEQENVRY